MIFDGCLGDVNNTRSCQTNMLPTNIAHRLTDKFVSAVLHIVRPFVCTECSWLVWELAGPNRIQIEQIRSYAHRAQKKKHNWF